MTWVKKKAFQAVSGSRKKEVTNPPAPDISICEYDFKELSWQLL
jgi:hypothetical protein